jgi:hypothetical protein
VGPDPPTPVPSLVVVGATVANVVPDSTGRGTSAAVVLAGVSAGVCAGAVPGMRPTGAVGFVPASLVCVVKCTCGIVKVVDPNVIVVDGISDPGFSPGAAVVIAPPSGPSGALGAVGVGGFNGT